MRAGRGRNRAAAAGRAQPVQQSAPSTWAVQALAAGPALKSRPKCSANSARVRAKSACQARWSSSPHSQRDGTAAPGQLAYAAQLEARGHAMAGDADAAERRLARAEELAALTADPAVNRPWSYWMTPGFFRSEEGMICAYLAGAGPRWHRRAVDLLGARLSEDVSLRTTASGLSCLALAHAQAGLVDERPDARSSGSCALPRG